MLFYYIVRNTLHWNEAEFTELTVMYLLIWQKVTFLVSITNCCPFLLNCLKYRDLTQEKVYLAIKPFLQLYYLTHLVMCLSVNT